MDWFKSNFRRILLVVAGAVAALTAEHTIAHRVADGITAAAPMIPETLPKTTTAKPVVDPATVKP